MNLKLNSAYASKRSHAHAHASNIEIIVNMAKVFSIRNQNFLHSFELFKQQNYYNKTKTTVPRTYNELVVYEEKNGSDSTSS